MQSPSQYPPHQPPTQPGSSGSGIIIAIVAIPIAIAVLGILATLSIYGVRKYIGNAKMAEARNSVGMMGRDAVTAYEERQHLCASASTPVPTNVPHGRRYQSATKDWMVDAESNAGFACLKFAIGTPQYYQYDYRATSTDFTAIAHGDLDADGNESSFELMGRVVDGRVVLAPALVETLSNE